MKCEICEEVFDGSKPLHMHLRKHKIKVKDYYEKYFPRKDLLTKKKIPFKDLESYDGSLFSKPEHLMEWLSANPTGKDRKDVLRGIFEERVKKKGDRLAWSESELMSRPIAPVDMIEKVFGDYHEFCSKIGVKERFNYSKKPSSNSLSPMGSTIFIDTRETQPLQFPSGMGVKMKLDFGDYTCSGDDFKNIYIERKSLSDFCSTLNCQLERFEKEIGRSVEANAYMVVMIETPLEVVRNYRPPTKRSAQGGHSALYQMRYLAQKYDNIQFLFVDDRVEAARVVLKILASGDITKKLDLQYHYNKGAL